jgi:hypothetical protein
MGRCDRSTCANAADTVPDPCSIMDYCYVNGYTEYVATEECTATVDANGQGCSLTPSLNAVGADYHTCSGTLAYASDDLLVYCFCTSTLSSR